MSGIFGIMQDTYVRMDHKDGIKRMALWNRAYGSGIQQTVIKYDFGIGCCYEEISEIAIQSSPVLVRGNKYIVIDAVLYNREELIEWCQIKNDVSDEELLFLYIDRFGTDALARVNGDFAGAIYDNGDKSLLLFRDHMGVRPLYYYHIGNELVCFSTDIRGITSIPKMNFPIREEWIYKAVTGYADIELEATEYRDIKCVRPGGCVKFYMTRWNKRKIEKSIYWQVGQNEIRYETEKEYIDKLRELITDAVKRRADVIPGVLGAELSGGLDSGTIDLLLNRMGREAIYFSWSEDPEKVPYVDKDERLVIRDICEQENIVCHYNQQAIELDKSSRIYKSLRKLGMPMKSTEVPLIRYALPPHMNTLNISKTSQFVKSMGANVVFTGHGGDEGVSHRCNAYELFYYREYKQYFKYMYAQTKGKKRRLIKTVKMCYRNIVEGRHKMNQPFRDPDSAPQILRKEFANKFNEKDMPALYFAYDAKAYVKMGGSRNRLDNVALQGAYSGVRYLVPYLDYRVIDFAVSIPRHLYLKDDMDRYIFREAFKDIMPESMYTLRTKMDYSRGTAGTFQHDEFCRRKKEVVKSLTRAIWDKYLDFKFLNEWVTKGEVSQEELMEDRKILMSLFRCLVAQNLVKKSKQIRVD